MADVTSSSASDRRPKPELPIDGDGVCMVCKQKPDQNQSLTCVTCVTPWHVNCLSEVPELASCLKFECPDCSGVDLTGAPALSFGNELVAKIKGIEADTSLTEKQKAKKRQQLLSGKADEEEPEEEKEKDLNSILALLDDSFKCSFCLQLPERPVSAPCGHNYCLKCFQKWIGHGERTCPKCRRLFPQKMASQPRINSALVESIRRAKSRSISSGGPPKYYHSLSNADLPDEPYVTERAKRGGIANAKSGRIFVTVPSDHFGPILADHDPIMQQGVLVGFEFENRYKCRQWGVHRPLVCGISGQSTYGAQSVVLSGGYMDDEDHGEWFLYTGSGGRDLSGNKRTNKDQSFHQEFKNFNQALRISCEKGYPVRVVRSHKEKRSSYAPEKELRYDGVYRIEKCWLKVGLQGFNVCRYLFVRCDNEPAPWTSDEHGDRPRPLPVIPELEQANDIFQRTESPSWDYDEVGGCWKWKKPPPPTKEKAHELDPKYVETARKAFIKSQNNAVREKLLKGFNCLLCKKLLNFPVSTPCAHNFCKSCLENSFAGQSFVRERRCQGGRQLRTQKNVMKCPECAGDISEFLQNIQVNREMMSAIEKLQNMGDQEENTNNEDANEEGTGSGKEDSDAGEASKSESSPEAEAEGSNENTLKRMASDACLHDEKEGTEKRKKADDEEDLSKINNKNSTSSPLLINPDNDC